MTPEFGPPAETALPRPEVMLTEVTERYRERIAAVLRDRRRRGVQEELAKARADTSADGRILVAGLEAAIGRATADGTDAFEQELVVVLSPETLEALSEKYGEAAVSGFFGGGGATPGWNVRTIQLVPGDPESQ
jgi:hypothetical protein